MRVRRQVADPLDNRDREVRRRGLVREVLADEAGKLVLVFQRVTTGDHAARAVAEQEYRQASLASLHAVDERREIRGPVRELLDEEALALRATAAAMIQRVDGEPAGGELLGGPLVQAAVRVQSMRDDDHAARLAGRLPLAREDPDAL